MAMSTILASKWKHIQIVGLYQRFYGSLASATLENSRSMRYQSTKVSNYQAMLLTLQKMRPVSTQKAPTAVDDEQDALERCNKFLHNYDITLDKNIIGPLAYAYVNHSQSECSAQLKSLALMGDGIMSLAQRIEGYLQGWTPEDINNDFRQWQSNCAWKAVYEASSMATILNGDKEDEAPPQVPTMVEALTGIICINGGNVDLIKWEKAIRWFGGKAIIHLADNNLCLVSEGQKQSFRKK